MLIHIFRRVFGCFFRKKKYSVLFFRNFISFKGGHLKVWDYYQHINKLPNYSSKVFFSKNSVWLDNPWKNRCVVVDKWDPNACDVLFIEGVDWVRLKGFELNENIPVINLIQGFRHADPNDRRYQYLSNKAIRICVSQEVKVALEATGKVKGPLFAIPNGIDLRYIDRIFYDLKLVKSYDVVISGIKNTFIAKELGRQLIDSGYSVLILLDDISRDLYLRRLAAAKVSVLLPEIDIYEGFYLPALESMAVGSFVVCPDCIGNRSFCLDGVNCFVPEYEVQSLFDVTLKALNMPDEEYDKYIIEGRSIASKYSLDKEREAFLHIMENLDNLWDENLISEVF